jgi:hypothetical protein
MRVSNHPMSLTMQRALIERARPAMRFALGQPLPVTDDVLTLYRGVTGGEPSRRVRGLSWTLDKNRAVRFAQRATHYGDPAVLTCRLHRRHVRLYTDERKEAACVV